MKEGERNSGHLLSRRKLLWVAGGVAAGAAVAYDEGITGGDIINGLSVAYEYGPDVAIAVVANPQQSLEAYRLWRGTEKKYRSMPFFGTNLQYRRDTPNAIVGFGDSNLEGAEGDGSKWRKSPLHLFREYAQKELGFQDWKDFNCAKGGFTTEMIMEMQVDSEKAREGFDSSPRCDVWVNAGGNDVSSLVNSPEEVDELKKLASDPFNNMSLLLKYTGRIEDNIDAFGTRFLDLLHQINTLYAPRIRQFVILSAPDFGRVDSIVTQEIDGNAYYVDIRNSAARRLIENVSIRINNEMFEAAHKFQEQTGKRIVGIDTSTPNISEFSRNQHFSEQACSEIARQALHRIDFIE